MLVLTGPVMNRQKSVHLSAPGVGRRVTRGGMGFRITAYFADYRLVLVWIKGPVVGNSNSSQDKVEGLSLSTNLDPATQGLASLCADSAVGRVNLRGQADWFVARHNGRLVHPSTRIFRCKTQWKACWVHSVAWHYQAMTERCKTRWQACSSMPTTPWD